ncbi:MAG TPA: fatty acid desaturase, partial [Saprospiraceae bacterium]|nr:fatty acid desaturase [Saprospiraceae bacterium]
DEDIDDKPFLRLSPFGKKKAYHKFQHLYALFIYSLATLSWIGAKDFRQLNLYNKTGVTKENGFNPTQVTIETYFTKIMYFTFLLILPMIFVAKWYIILLGFLTMHMVAGFIITVIFQLAHVVEGTQHHHIEEGPVMENTWAKHQIQTTANFSTKNKLLTWLIGGLSHQIEHHLFPNISHVHYPQISKIIKSTVTEFGLPYHEYSQMSTALASHLRMLRQIGNA